MLRCSILGGVQVMDGGEQSKWFEVIGKALTYLCLQQAKAKEPEKFDAILKEIEFLEGLGLSQDDAAMVAGSSAKSIAELRRRERNVKSGKTKSKAKKKSNRR